tara:strand:+ start:351 stop:485 length:135 start_codon:yes stop_codon:yes gene_type:complete
MLLNVDKTAPEDTNYLIYAIGKLIATVLNMHHGLQMPDIAPVDV